MAGAKFTKGQGVVFNGTNAVVMADETSAGKVAIRVVSTGVQSVVAKGELKASWWAAEEPQLWEAAVNIAIFELEQLALRGKKGLMDSEAVAFFIESVLYDGLLKNYMSMFSFAYGDDSSIELSDTRGWIETQDLQNTVARTVQVGLILDTVYRAIRGQKQLTKERFTYLVKMAVAFGVGNIVSRKFIAPNQAKYLPE